MSREQEGISRCLQGLIGIGHGFVGRQNREVFDALCHRMFDSQAGDRRCRLESYSEENHFLLRVLHCKRHCVKRRVDHLDISALAADVSQTLFCARNSDQIPERTHLDVVIRRQHDRLVDKSDLRDADRASRTRDEFYIFRKQAADSVLKDLMGMCSAHLHDPDLRAFIALDDLPRFLNRIRAHTASSSSILAMAMPAWTMT